jgi:2,3-dihydroxybenzoate decarboxylase
MAVGRHAPGAPEALRESLPGATAPSGTAFQWSTRTLSPTPRPRVIAIEEHSYDPELAAPFEGLDAKAGTRIRDRLLGLGAVRLKEMDEAGVDVQVLSHSAPSTQKLDPVTAARAARQVNDRLHRTIQARPDRFRGFAALPSPDPKAAADELARAVNELRMQGAMVHGLTGGTLFIDDRHFWPIFERVQSLDEPIYIHPASPHPAVIDAYYKEYAEKFPALLGAGWAFTVEAATHAIRMVLSGLFQAYPRLKSILGHLGETLPFLLWRIDHALARPGNAPGRVPRAVLPALLRHHQRVLLRPGDAVLPAGDGRGPHPLRRRLPVRGEQQAGGAVDGSRRGFGRGSGDDPERQCAAPAALIGKAAPRAVRDRLGRSIPLVPGGSAARGGLAPNCPS